MAAPSPAARGFTLLEAVLVMVIIGVIFGTLASGAHDLVDNAAEAESRQRSASETRAVVAEIEQLIRLAEEIEVAGVDVLEARTRYFVDGDDGIERVGYRRQGRVLERAITDADAALVDWVPVLEDVTAFSTSWLEISDSFDADDYDGVAYATGAPEPTDAAVTTRYAVHELGRVDADLLAAYDAASERVQIVSDGASPTTVTFTPALPRAWLHAECQFIPLQAGVEYRPLVYGEETRNARGVAIVFAPDGTIHLQVYEGGALSQSATAPLAWSASRAYEVSLAFTRDAVVARIDDGATSVSAGPVSPGSIDNVRLHGQNVDGTIGGQWDELEVEYTFVPVELETGPGPTVWHGGAALRSSTP